MPASLLPAGRASGGTRELCTRPLCCPPLRLSAPLEEAVPLSATLGRAAPEVTALARSILGDGAELGLRAAAAQRCGAGAVIMVPPVDAGHMRRELRVAEERRVSSVRTGCVHASWLANTTPTGWRVEATDCAESLPHFTNMHKHMHMY